MNADEEARGALEEGRKLEEAKNYDAALSAYDRALSFKPDYFDGWEARASLMWSLGKYREAVKSFDMALKYSPGGFLQDTSLWHGRGLVLTAMGKYRKAIGSFNRGLKSGPGYLVDNWVGRGDALAALGKYQEAIESYEKALEHDVKEAWEGRANALDLLEEWLKKKRPPHPYVELYKLVTATEERLHLFIRQRLQQVFGEEESGWWFQGIPLAIRQKCAQRREEDPRRQHYYNYTDLIDLKDIMDKNWKLFELDFQRVKGDIKSKREFLDNLVKLNEIRKIVMHPVRGAPTEDDFELARKMREVIESFAGPG